MSESTPAAPPNLTSLQARIRNHAGSEAAALNARRTIALIVLGQILLSCETAETPSRAVAAIKGGTAMRLRYGPSKSRFSSDFDAARAQDLNTFLATFTKALTKGWGGFTGDVKESRSKARPDGVPEGYIMVAYDVKLKYKGALRMAKPFLTVRLEIGADELGDTVNPPRILDSDVVALFTAIGLPTPVPVPVIGDDHQIAQKLHAVSVPGSERAHDLIDLQLLARDTHLADHEVASTCRRLFSFRRRQSWPPTIVEGATWPSLYEAQIGDLQVLSNVTEAVQWVNDYVQRLDLAH